MGLACASSGDSAGPPADQGVAAAPAAVGNRSGRSHDVIWLEWEIVPGPLDPPVPHPLKERAHESAPGTAA
jgi:hypothetical protein